MLQELAEIDDEVYKKKVREDLEVINQRTRAEKEFQKALAEENAEIQKAVMTMPKVPLDNVIGKDIASTQQLTPRRVRSCSELRKTCTRSRTSSPSP